MSAKRLTPAQRDALALVAEGKVYGSWPIGPDPMRWMHADHWQPLRARPYEALRSAGLITVRSAGWGSKRSAVELTDAGRAEIRRLEVKDCAPDCEERATCPKIGGLGHMQCGECPDHEKPRHHCGCLVEVTP